MTGEPEHEGDRWLMKRAGLPASMEGDLLVQWYESGIPRLVEFLSSPAAFSGSNDQGSVTEDPG